MTYHQVAIKNQLKVKCEGFAHTKSTLYLRYYWYRVCMSVHYWCVVQIQCVHGAARTVCFINITEEPHLKECQNGKHPWSTCADRIEKFDSTYVCLFEYFKYSFSCLSLLQMFFLCLCHEWIINVNDMTLIKCWDLGEKRKEKTFMQQRENNVAKNDWYSTYFCR